MGPANVQRAMFIFVMACGGARGGDGRAVVQRDVTPVAPSAVANADRGELELFLLGEHIGTERFEVTKQTMGYRLKLDAVWRGQSWTMDYRVNDDWSVMEVVVEKPGACTLRLRPLDGVMEWHVQRGRDTWVADREPLATIYYVAMRPAVTQHALCAVATDRPVTLQNMPAFRVEVGPRVSTTLPDGRRLDRVRVDDLIDLFCDGKRVAIVHYARHGFLAVRSEYAAFGRDLAARDPRTEPWAGDFDCPTKPR